MNSCQYFQGFFSTCSDIIDIYALCNWKKKSIALRCLKLKHFEKIFSKCVFFQSELSQRRFFKIENTVPDEMPFRSAIFSLFNRPSLVIISVYFQVLLPLKPHELLQDVTFSFRIGLAICNCWPTCKLFSMTYICLDTYHTVLRKFSSSLDLDWHMLPCSLLLQSNRMMLTYESCFR